MTETTTARSRLPDGLAVVTGAAGGIGAAVVALLVERGMSVAAFDRDVAGLEALAKGLPDAPVRTHEVDVADEGSVTAAVAAVEETHGPIELLVNAAGVLRPGPAATMSADDWRAMFGVNLGGVVHCSKAVTARMRTRGRGVVVTVASNAGRVPRTDMAAYGASKAAASLFTRTLGLELAGDGIRANVVSPGSTDTSMLHGLWADESGRASTIEGSLATYKLGIPLQRIARPEEIARVVAFLASDEAVHITMQDLCVDGGAVLGA